MHSRILIFTTAVGHTTFRKTADMLSKEGAKIHIIGFTRGNYPFNQKLSDIEIESLGKLEHGNYLRRIFVLLGFLFRLRRRAQDYDIIYTFTLDTLLISRISLLFKKKTYIYHIQDIRSIFFGNSLKSRLARFLEGKLLRKVSVLVVSSKDYFTGYFAKRYGFPNSRVVVIENKLPRQFDITERDKKLSLANPKITIGYFGVMRCIRSWEILKNFTVNNSDNFYLYLRGKPMAVPDISEQISTLDNIVYDGLYKSPDELVDLYSRVDIVWAAYPYTGVEEGNWKYARTIRFYEACAFQKPVIVQKGTPQAKDVERYNIGLVLDMNDIAAAIKCLKESITPAQISQWKENLAYVPREVYVHGHEYRELLAAIEQHKLK